MITDHFAVLVAGNNNFSLNIVIFVSLFLVNKDVPLKSRLLLFYSL